MIEVAISSPTIDLLELFVSLQSTEATVINFVNCSIPYVFFWIIEVLRCHR
jgi:hypothetical protein